MSQPEILRWDQAYNRNGESKLPRAVLNVIRTYMNNHTLTGWVSQETLARDTGLDESNVRRQIRKNEDAGWLVVTKRGRSGRASEYRLAYPQPGEYARLSGDGDEGSTGRIRPVTTQGEPGSNRANMPGYTPQPGADARLLSGADARPTSPSTSPQEKCFIEGQNETGTDSRSPDAGSRATGGVAPSRGLSDPWSPDAAIASGDDPFASEPAWRAEHRARESKRADRDVVLTGSLPDPFA